MHELWKPIIGYEGIYEVSNMGNIRSIDRHRADGAFISGRKIKTSLAMGYPYFNACKNGRSSPIYVHQCVAEAFIGLRPDGFQINHIDGDKRNNFVGNLEYVTPSQNMSHAISRGLNVVPRPDNRGENHGMSKLLNSDIPDIKHLLSSGHSVEEVSGIYGVSRATINDIKRGVSWKHIL